MRTRFAPSPTGFLHIGNLRTAFFAWLMARKTNGSFALRIEDTDRAREVTGAVESILRVLAWAGMKPDEGVMPDDAGNIVEKGSHGPYIQSKRFDLYRTYADQLLKDGHAYRCFCTPERLDEMRKKQEKLRQAPMYDRTCLELDPAEVEKRVAAGEKHVLRLKVPREETIAYEDKIYGPLSFKGHTVDDQVLLKSDGFPTYHLANVVDDHLMEIDLVIRGEEWLSSTPKHLILFKAFGWRPPQYAHVPLLLNPDRSKLSKRQGDVAAEDFIKKGYLPEALMNFLALLGWNPGTEQELFTITELIESFTLERIHKSGAVFDLKKLDWIQGQWMRKIPAQDFADRIRPLVTVKYPDAANDSKFLQKAALIQERITFFPEAPDMLGFFYTEPTATMELIANPKQKVTEADVPKILGILKTAVESIDEKKWTKDAIVTAIDAALASSGLKKGQLLWVLRASLTCRAYSPGAYEVAEILGREKALLRLKKIGI
ncbi:MAG: glutamate--tRNA ligase [Candidatus Peribacteraceae bacterium]|nr:glutamate--tRNA ligase [Candidatus Peribacteraceae bacterium]